MATRYPFKDVCGVWASLNMNWLIGYLREPYVHAGPDVPDDSIVGLIRLALGYQEGSRHITP